MQFNYYCPTELRVGRGQLASLAESVNELGKRPLVVIDPDVRKVSASAQQSCTVLSRSGLSAEIFEEIPSNPNIETVTAGAEVFRKHQADVVVAIGGGSALDSAKAIAAVAEHGGSIWDYIGDDLVPGPIAPIVAVPTTAGTGSETTPFAVFTDKGSRRKDGMYSRYFYPRLSILDPEIYCTLPPQITAETGMDALAHAIEGFTARTKNSLCNSLALEAVRLIARSLTISVQDGSNLEARQEMALASALAGIVITHCGVGAAHGVGMSLGGLYDVPHGRAIAMLLPSVMEFNRQAAPDQFAALHRVFQGADPDMDQQQNVAEIVSALARKIGIPVKLSDLGVRSEQIDELLNDAMSRQDMQNNARTIDRADAEQLLRTLL